MEVPDLKEDWAHSYFEMSAIVGRLRRHSDTGTILKNLSGSGGIRTHAPEETGALNQRLRPLGHATLMGGDQ